MSGKSGHQRTHSPEKKKPFSGMAWYNRNFHKRNENGHKLADCWEKEEIASKQPHNWVSTKNKGGTGLAIFEILVMQIETGTKEYKNDHIMVAALEGEKGVEDDCTVGQRLCRMNESCWVWRTIARWRQCSIL